MFDFLFKNKKDKDEEKEDNESKTKMAVGITLDQSIQNSTSKAGTKYSKPAYNQQTRKQYYDDGKAHKAAMDEAFANNAVVRDRYTGDVLVKSQKEAKALYGKDWQKEAGEFDHIDPISQIVKRWTGNAFVTTDDIKEVANRKGNGQIISRQNNQTSAIGKGGKTQEQWADGLTGISEEQKNKIREIGKKASKENDRLLFRKSVSNIATTAHEAGMDGLKSAGATTVTMSGIMNCVAVIKGEKDAEEAISDTVKDGGKAAVSGYITGGGLATIEHAISYSSGGVIKALADSNVPGKIITAVTVTGDTLVKWGNGEITTQECLIQLGDKGLNMATMGYSMAVGQALIPVPVVGGAIGALVGSMFTSAYYNDLVCRLQQKQLEHEERIRIIAECEKAANQARKFREELEIYLNNYFEDYRECFDTALSSMHLAYQLGDADGVIAGANQITRKLGGNVYYETTEEFKKFIDEDSIDIL